MALTIGATGNVWAVKEYTNPGNTLTVKVTRLPQDNAGSETVDFDGRKVTITITPTDDYKVAKVVAEGTIDPSLAPARRGGLLDNIIYDSKTANVSGNVHQFTIPDEDYNGANVTITFYKGEVTPITSLDEIENPGDDTKTYQLVADVDASGWTSIAEFKATLDGSFHKITNLSTPLFTKVNGGIVKNITFENVTISSGDGDGDAGAVCCKAEGTSRIYNCGILPSSIERDNDGNITGFTGSTVSGSRNVGGLVGTLSGSARVINCFSYANITGGTNRAGIVGYNNVTSTQSSLTTMVMNCMFYGDISTGGTISPIYGGKEINNVAGGMNNYNYYRYRSRYSVGKEIGTYNRALAMEEKFINRFERYRLLLNSNKKLAAKYASTVSTTVNPNDMAKWVLETADRSISGRDPYPYPVLKAQGKYPSIINYDVEHAPDSASVGRLNGGKLGKTLSVTISNTKTNGGQTWPTGASITTSSLTLQRTDKDTVRFNFNYDKVQLPYYNDVGKGNYTENRVVTGWKITSITGGTAGEYNAEDTWGGYNFANRKCTNKDKYDVSKRVFSQGAYWDVPEGVTAITIEPYWAIANYVSDATYDVVYNKDYAIQTFTPFGTQYSNNTDIDIYNDDNNQKVYTSISNALAGFDNSNKTVYDQAVVLVGNVHQYANPTASDIPYTVMSIDMNHDNEPDYSYIFSHDSRRPISPIRYDFLNIMGIAEAQIPKSATLLRNVSIFNLKGWFEITNTCLVNFSQFEYENSQASPNPVAKSSAPLILLGGTFEQFVSTQKTTRPASTQYIHVGGNAWFAKFGNGTHSDGNGFTPHIPISVTGGDYDEFYLSGTYQPTIPNMESDNAECYISGGRFGEVAGASLEAIQGDVRWDINWADITNFYGGGVNGVNPITGDIRVDMTNSYVNRYCGGPKFGDMTNGKTVTTNATDCVFGTYFGAGFGGNAYNRVKYRDESGKEPADNQNLYQSERGKYYDGSTTNAYSAHPDYGKKGKGVATDFDSEFFIWSTGVIGARFFVKFVTFSLATTHGVTSNLTKCKVTGNVYGGGSLGKVDGDVSTTLNSCEISGNVFGAGYSATLPKIGVRNTPAFIAGKEPKKNMNIGMFEPGEINTTEEYEWKQVASSVLTNGETGMVTENSSGKKYVYTDTDLTALGTVTGKVTLNIEGSTTVAGNVYGGGESSDATNDVMVNVKGGTMTDVFGGGKGQTTVVGGDVTVNIGTLKEGSTTEYEGTAEISGSVYGGSALGAVNAAKQTNSISYVDGKNTFVNLNKGTVNGAVYGGGLGAAAVGTEGEQGYVAPISANVYGPVTVTTKGGTAAKVFGCNNLMGAPQQTVSVNIDGGNIASAYGGGNLAGYSGTPTVVMTGGNVGNVYGGGYGASASVAGSSVTMKNGTGEGNTGGTAGYVFGGGEEAPVTGSVVVNIQGGTVSHDVYGGGALAHTNTANWNAAAGTWANVTATSTANTTTVRLTGGTIVGDAYGGGLGDTDTPAYVYGDVLVDLNGETTYDTDGKIQTAPVTAKGCIVNRVFGCNNVNGTPKGEVTVHVHATQSGVDGKETVGAKAEKNTNTYDVQAVYGGGNQAEYYPVRADRADATEENHVHTNVIVDGCQLTSIRQVYGGGNAASSPATSVTIYGAYEIGEVFGGGNGKDDIAPGVANPGAHVGFHKYDSDTDKANQQYGFGKAQVNIGGGTIHSVFGGSNSKGNVRDIAVATLDDLSDCDFRVGEAYGGGKEAEMDGRAVLRLGCIPAGGLVGDIYGGAKMTNVNNDVELTITNGTFTRVYGGNNLSGRIKGTITVNVVESGCTPIIIDQLFGGGNQAAYSVEDIPEANRVTDATAADYYKNFPKVNIISATRIGQVYGGGDNAGVTGNPHVKIDMTQGQLSTKQEPEALGVIGQVFGGGNNADVTGNTHVEIVKGQITYDQVVKTAATATTAAEYYLPGIYGGCNTQGTISGDTHVTVKGGTIGVGTLNLTATPKVMTRTKKGNVHGGGYGKDTYVAGSVTVNIGETMTSGDAVIFGDVYGGGALGHVNAQKTGETMTFTTGTTTVNLNKGVIYGDAYGGGLGLKQGIDGATADQAAHVGGDIQVNQNGVAFIIEYVNTTDKDPDDDTQYIKVVNSGRIFGSNNLCGSPNGNITVTVNKTVEGNVAKTAADDVAKADATHSYELAAVYGGGNLAPYSTEGKKTNVIIKGCGETSIETVYGGGNAAAVPETDVDVYGTYEIGYVFGGGNGKDKYQTDAGWIANPGANVNGNANTMLYGGVVHEAYGGSNEQGTITGDVAIDMSATNPEETCELDVDKLVGAGKNADVNGNLMMVMGCKPNKLIPLVYGGADNANVNGNVELTITSGRFGQVFGGNNLGGAIKGHIILNIEETGECGTPITIDELYLGGNEAAYSVYGYNDDGSCKTSGDEIYDNPILNLISCTRIGKVFGGGLGTGAAMYANPTVNINMIPGSQATAYNLGTIGDVYGGGNQAEIHGKATVNIGTASKVTVKSMTHNTDGTYTAGTAYVQGARIVGNVFGGGNKATVAATEVNIGTVAYTDENYAGVTISCKDGEETTTGMVFGGGNDADVTGNTVVNMAGGYVRNRIYGGGNLGSIGTFTNNTVGKPDTWTEGTGKCTVTISGGKLGKDNMTMPEDFGYVFGASRGETKDPATDPDIDFRTYVKETEVTINGTALILGGVYGGSENGHVRGNTKVMIKGGQIGAGQGMTTAYADEKFIDPSDGVTETAALAECSHLEGATGSTFYGNVFGGGSGYFPYAEDKWLKNAGLVEGNTTVEITGGHILSNVYGGCELTDVLGTATVTMSGGSIGVPRTKEQVEAHPMSCSLFGGGKGDSRAIFDDYTNVGSTKVEVTGGTIYGSVFGGAEDGHVTGDADVAVSGGIIGIKGVGGESTGNVYGGGKGRLSNGMAGLIKGDTKVTVSDGKILHNVYGGGAYGSVGTITSATKNESLDNGFGLSWPYKLTYADGTGTTTVNVTGGVIGVSGTTGGDVYGAARGEAGDRYEMAQLGNVRETKVTIQNATIWGSVYGGAENGHVNEDTDVKINDGAIVKHSVFGGGKGMGKYPVTLYTVQGHNAYTADIYSMTAGKVYGNTYVTMTGGEVGYNVYGGGDMGSVGKGNYAGGADDYSTEGYGETLTGNLWSNGDFMNSGKTNVKITGGTIGTGTDATNTIMPTGNVFGGCRGEASPNVDPTLVPRYHYFPVYYVGYINESNVEIDGGSILGSVYGGGQDGHVRRSTKVTVNDGVIGKEYDANDSQKENRGNVYGSGSGLGVYKYDVEQVEHEAHSTASGSVTCNTVVNIKGGTIYQNVYGGGALSSVGAPKIEQAGDATKAQTLCQVNIEGGDIGTAAGFTNHQYGGLVFGAGRGGGLLTGEDPADYATSIWTEVNVKGGTVHGSVFGGGEQGLVKQSVEVNITGGTVEHDVYGGGALANTNTSNSEGKTDECTTAVNLTGGTIGSAYGGALGQKTGINGATSDVAAYVNGDVTVTLNGSVVTGSVFGCNNINGTPKGHTLVYVKQTKPRDGHTYDVDAVYGGGSRADYDPIDAKKYTEVIIEGCDQTSIEEVYGGGYGAATPGTLVLIKGTKIIDNVFGGGYGASTETFSNPGANVGYHTDGSPYSNSNKAVVQLMAGKVNNVYGGSNSKGDIRSGSSVTNVANTGGPECCTSLDVQHIYGGGKNAEMQGGTEIVLGCMPNDWIAEIYAGAENADVGNDVSLTITSGKFGRVFGGNKSGGRLNGGIDVKIEESGKCGTPIVIGELYGGGNEAPYSVYGYKDEKDSNGKWIPRQLSDFEAMTPEQRQAESMESGPNHAPRVHVRAFTSIGNIFGGGYGADAVMVGSPEVNINEVMVVDEDGNPSSVAYDVANDSNVPAFIDGVNVKLYPHEAKKMGVIGNVFGGGNAAKVIGDTYVNVAIDPSVDVHVMDAKGDPVINSEGVHTFQSRPVLGADIRGNVYGGGNNAEVTGKTNVQIGR